MVRTFAKLGTYMQKEKTNALVLGRTTKHNTTDTMGQGINIIINEKMMTADVLTESNAGHEAVEAIEMEVEDNGDLDAF